MQLTIAKLDLDYGIFDRNRPGCDRYLAEKNLPRPLYIGHGISGLELKLATSALASKWKSPRDGGTETCLSHYRDWLWNCHTQGENIMDYLNTGKGYMLFGREIYTVRNILDCVYKDLLQGVEIVLVGNTVECNNPVECIEMAPVCHGNIICRYMGWRQRNGKTI